MVHQERIAEFISLIIALIKSMQFLKMYIVDTNVKSLTKIVKNRSCIVRRVK